MQEATRGFAPAPQQGAEPPAPSSTALLASFAERANRPLAQRQLNAGTEFALGRRDGAYIWNLENTHRLIDCATTGGVHSLGHRNPELLEALHDALAACAPKGLDRSVVTLCASQANDLALFCAFRTAGRRGIVAARTAISASQPKPPAAKAKASPATTPSIAPMSASSITTVTCPKSPP